MSCSPFDLRDYLLEELAAGERRQVEKHVSTCAGCRDELQRLQLTHAALRSLPDEEIPRGIAFVSDKVFEPAPWRRAWQTFWGSWPRLVFASAAMLSAALVFTSVHRPAAPAVVSVPAATVDTARLEADFNRRLDDAVRQAVAQSEARQEQKTAALIASVRKQDEFDRNAMRMQVEQSFDVLQKRYNSVIISANNALSAAMQGESK